MQPRNANDTGKTRQDKTRQNMTGRTGRGRVTTHTCEVVASAARGRCAKRCTPQPPPRLQGQCSPQTNPIGTTCAASQREVVGMVVYGGGGERERGATKRKSACWFPNMPNTRQQACAHDNTFQMPAPQTITSYSTLHQRYTQTKCSESVHREQRQCRVNAGPG